MTFYSFSSRYRGVRLYRMEDMQESEGRQSFKEGLLIREIRKYPRGPLFPEHGGSVSGCHAEEPDVQGSCGTDIPAPITDVDGVAKGFRFDFQPGGGALHRNGDDPLTRVRVISERSREIMGWDACTLQFQASRTTPASGGHGDVDTAFLQGLDQDGIRAMLHVLNVPLTVCKAFKDRSHVFLGCLQE